MTELLYRAPRGEIWHGDSTRELPDGERWSCVVADPPYSARCHDGHRDGVINGNMPSDGADRRHFDYPTWTPADVARAVAAWHARTDGWICIMTDHLLARAWEAEMEAAGRYVFAPIPCVSPGSRVRLCGDGPSSWTVWLIVSRPRHAPYCKWGTLPGAYIYPPERMPLVGGKPVHLLEMIVNDYSRPGDLVADPTCGAGSCCEAAELLGRRYWGMDSDLEHAKMAAGRMGGGLDSGPLFT